jgi:hypothetical protein
MKKTFLFLLPFLLFQCTSKTDNSSERAFYYWKTTMDFDKTSDSLANDLNLKTIYVRYFDVDWSPSYKDAIPVGILNENDWEGKAHFKNKKVIPTVFITNKTFRKLDEKGIERLAENLSKKIEQVNEKFESWYVDAMVEFDDFKDSTNTGETYRKYRKAENAIFQTMISEIQIDCDWTESTRDNFFQFLELLKPKLNGKTLSCTVRLHQYRDRKLMGIPPVDRGLLMCYNVGNVQQLTTKNAILDAEIVKQYLKGKTYPIKLDIGLPIFSWAAWYRGNEFKGIVSGWNEVDAENQNLYKETSNHRYFLEADTVIGDNYLREGDLLRWDNGFENEMTETIALLKANLDLSGIRIAFFDWEAEKVKRHRSEIEGYYLEFE